MKDLTQAWDLYYHVFRRITKQLPQVSLLTGANWLLPPLNSNLERAETEDTLLLCTCCCCCCYCFAFISVSETCLWLNCQHHGMHHGVHVQNSPLMQHFKPALSPALLSVHHKCMVSAARLTIFHSVRLPYSDKAHRLY